MLFKPTFQVADTLDATIDDLLPHIHPASEDVWELVHYATNSGKWWLQVTDQPQEFERVLHLFMPQGVYKRSVNGNVTQGLWWWYADSNKLEVQLGTLQPELYQLYFLSPDFFILKKDGDPMAQRRYLAMGYEVTIGNLNWADYCLLLYDQHQQATGFRWIVLAVLVFVAIVGVFSC